MKEVYLDNAATTKVDETVLSAMLPFFKEDYGNPSSMHYKGIAAKDAVDSAREKVAKLLNASPKEIIFTGSGTESDNLAILGYVRKNKDKGKHIITTKIEHHAVIDPFEKLKSEGFDVTYLDVDKEGILNINTLKEAIRKDTFFVSIIYANNEIGSVQDIKEIAKVCKENNITLHTDACQATSYLDINVKNLDVDLMTINGSKIYGPKGIGVLYKKENITLEPIVYGGGQEFNIRSGTENVANIAGFAKALELAIKHKDEETKKLTLLRDHMIEELLKIDETILNGHKEKRLPNNVNISFLNVEGESILLHLNEKRIYASTGSACSSSSLEPSHVLLAIGRPHEIAHASIRFSLGKDTTIEEIDYTISSMKDIIKKLRDMSPLNYTMKEILKKGDKDE